ncbi:hypothetical protein CVT25_006387 [Psilocybe cyanescens]|uniref:FHA domain-containing protein n=1 Tax=Psilocybe cyanescens TaxID=93625 RepID=A0A409XKH6_PSICY|nr:hypothetical protein CVT25_006387 [Psilocybe cyanescens]
MRPLETLWLSSKKDSTITTHIVPRPPYLTDPSIDTFPTEPHNTTHTALCPHPRPSLRAEAAPSIAIHLPALERPLPSGRQIRRLRQREESVFYSKMLSRQHAEVLEEGGKIYIKDITSSNGTFINDKRLSSEGHNSDPFELKSDDIADTHVAARAEQHQRMHSVSGTDRGLHVQQRLGIAGLGGVGGIGVGRQPPGVIVGLGGMNGGRKPKSSPSYTVPNLPKASAAWVVSGCGPLGKTGLMFGVILSRLQGEVQKNWETGAELAPADLPLFPIYLPPICAPPQDMAQPLPTAPVVVPASISTEGATGGAGTSPSSSSPPAATTSSGAERERLRSVGATATSSASSAASATVNPSTSTSTQPTTTTASDNNATALPEAIIQDLQSQLAGHFERMCHLEGVMLKQ